MAEKVIIDIVAESKSINEFRTNIAAVKKVLNEAQVGSKEFEEATESLAKGQQALNNVMKLGKKSVDDADKSYIALTRRMAQFKEEWRATNDEARRNELGAQIAEINQQLKDMDASIGNYQRNVGNYESAFNAFGGSLQGLLAPINAVKMALKALMANPILATIAAVAAALKAVVGAMKKSEEGLARLNIAMSGFKAIGDVVTKVLEKLGGALGWVIEKCATLLGKVLGLQEETEQYKRIQEEELALQKERRRVAEENAEIELRIAELRNKASDKLNVSAKERIAALQEAMRLEKQISTSNINLATREYNLIKEKNSLTESSTEDLNRESEAKRNITTIQADLNNKMREYNAQLKEATNEMIIQEGKKAEQAAMEERLALKRAEFEENVKIADEEIALQERTNNALMGGLANLQGFRDAIYQRDAKNKEAEHRDDLALLGHKKQTVAATGQLLSAASNLVGQQTAAGKALAVASALISTYQSAQMAYQSAFLPVPTVASPALGAISAAAAVVSGLANVKQILSVDTSGNSMPSIGGASTPAFVQPPAVVQEVPVTRSLTSASEEERLNKMARDTRVFLVYSDVEQAGKQVEVQQTEASF